MPIEFVKAVNVPYYLEDRKDEILQLWLDWVAHMDNTFEAEGYTCCFFCGGEYFIITGKENHKDDCIYNLTKEYLRNPYRHCEIKESE